MRTLARPVVIMVLGWLVLGSPAIAQQPHSPLTVDSGETSRFEPNFLPVEVKRDGADSPRAPTGRRRTEVDPYQFVTRDDLLDILEHFTSIRPHLGWRHSTTIGESEAIGWVENQLAELAFLQTAGIETERHPFRTFTGVEFWDTSLTLTRGDEEFHVLADGGPGHRDIISRAVRFDSDGRFNDRQQDPVIIEGPPRVIRSADEIYNLTPSQLAGRVVLLDFALIDRSIMTTNEAVTRAWTLVEKRPAAIIKITQYSNVNGESHGSFTGDVGAYTYVDVETDVPVLNVRIEDLADFGIRNWNDLDDVESIEVVWDVDLFAPGDSEYLMARIPGADPSQAVILGAHIDSPNTPGAFDDGSGSSALVEVARALDRARIIPSVDLYLVWFGSHERGLYGSYNFTADHSELLDRTIAMVQMDCLGHPLDGYVNQIWLETWSYGSYGDDSIPLPSYLGDLAQDRAIPTRLADVRSLVSDNSSFSGYDVPNANMIFMNPLEPIEVHYGNHLHDPYDDIDLARLEGEAFEDMATIMLSAALNAGADDPDLRVTPEPTHRAVFVASHTEGIHMSPAGLTDFGMSLAWNGFDVDVVPYGTLVTADDLADADVVVVLPVHDYPTPEVDTTIYDESWTDPEIDALEDYVLNGGLLILTNTAHRLKYFNLVYDENEDWSDANALGQRFGVQYRSQMVDGNFEMTHGSHPIIDGVAIVYFAADNGHTFRIQNGDILAGDVNGAALASVEHGAGEVIVLTDIGMLGAVQDPPRNRRFFQNIADYAR